MRASYTAYAAGSAERAMFKLPFGRKRSQSFGLDIGSSAVKVVELREAGDGYALGALAVVPLPPDTIADGTIKDPPTVIAAIKQAVAEAGIKSRDAVIGIC